MSDLVTRLDAALEGRYRILRELGSGGMATVYLARDVRHERDVALKVLREELVASIGTERFLQEVRITANLQHPHILPLFDSGEADGFLFYVMPYVDGESLKDRLARERELPVSDAIRILRDVVDGLSAAHAAGVVHRDIKPANILLTGRHAVVADFGVAKALSDAKVEARLTTMGTSLGTPTYMSPEQAAADETVDHRSDVYALGVVAYEMLTGGPPFEGGGQRQLLMAHITQEPKPLRERRVSVPEPLAGAVMRCLAKKPADRWQRVDDLLPFLEGVGASSGGMTPAGLEPVRAGGWRGRARLLVPLAAVAVLAFGLVLQSRRAGDTGAPDSVRGATTVDTAWTGLRLALLPPENASSDSSWDYLGDEVLDEMRRSVARHASAAEILAEEAGATHVLRTRYTLAPERITLSGEVFDGRTGDMIRALDPVRVPPDSAGSLVAQAGDRAAVVAMQLVFHEGDPSWLRDWTLAPTPVIQTYAENSKVAAFSGRSSDAADWMLRIIEAAPDHPTPYLMLRGELNNAGRSDEWTPALDSMAQVMLDRATPRERDQYLLIFGPTLGERIAAAERNFERQGGDGNTGYFLAFRAINANRLELARRGLDGQDAEDPLVRGYASFPSADALVRHLEGDYESELIRVREALERSFPTDRHAQLIQGEIRALLALGQEEEASARFRELQDIPMEPHDLWHILHNVALEARRHGEPEASRRFFLELLAWSERQELGDVIDLPSTYYGLERYDKVVELLEPMFSEAGAWIGPDATLPMWRVAGASLLVMSLEALGRSDDAARYQPALEMLGRARDFGRRWPVLVAARRGDAVEATRLLREAIEDEVPIYSLGDYPDNSLFLHNRPELERLREDPVFQNLMAPR